MSSTVRSLLSTKTATTSGSYAERVLYLLGDSNASKDTDTVLKMLKWHLTDNSSMFRYVNCQVYVNEFVYYLLICNRIKVTIYSNNQRECGHIMGEEGVC